MKHHLRALPLALLTAIGANGLAAPAQVAKIDYSSKTTQTCAENNCTGTSKGTLQIIHSFDLPEAAVAAFNPDTLITVSATEAPIRFKLSEDPKYTKGAKSARITKALELDYFGDAQVTVQLSWTSNHFQAVITAKVTGNGVLKRRAKAEHKALTADLVTEIESANVTPVTQADEVPVDYTSTGSYISEPDGDSRGKYTTVLKTVPLVE